jgi:hypothetical protein
MTPDMATDEAQTGAARGSPGTCSLTLTIAGTDYRLRPVARGDLGPDVLVAWTLRKAGTATRHVAAETIEGPTCDREDHLYRRRPCKHIRAMRAMGLLF